LDVAFVNATSCPGTLNVQLTSEGFRIDDKSRSRIVESNRYEAVYRGLPLIPGLPAGTASVRDFLGRLEHGSVVSLAHLLQGNYLLVVRDKLSRTMDCFVDPSGMHTVYVMPGQASTSFFEMVRAARLGPGDMDEEAVVEFLQLGRVFRGRTLFPSIRRLRHDELLRFREGCPQGELLPKPLPEVVVTDPVEHFLRAVEPIAESLRGERISFDLTGGTDSRLLVVLGEYHGLDYELAIACASPKLPDVPIARRVAEVLGKPLHVAEHRVPEASLADEFPAMLRVTEGMSHLFTAHRITRLQADRAGRGVTLSIAGEAGGMYKDFWWLQDFPFYGRRRANVDRLLSTRIVPVMLNQNILSERMREAYRRWRAGFRDHLHSFESPELNNTQTYDRIALDVFNRTYVARDLADRSYTLEAYAPLFERVLVHSCLDAPRRLRFDHNFFRRIISRLSPRISRVRTNFGTRLSTNRWLRLLDGAAHGGALARRLAKLAGRKLFGRTWFQPSPNDPHLKTNVRRCTLFARAVRQLVESGFARRGLGPSDVPEPSIERVLSLGMLIEWLQQSPEP